MSIFDPDPRILRDRKKAAVEFLYHLVLIRLNVDENTIPDEMPFVMAAQGFNPVIYIAFYCVYAYASEELSMEKIAVAKNILIDELKARRKLIIEYVRDQNPDLT